MSVTVHRLCLPLDTADVRQLAVGDQIALSGDVTISIGLPAHARMAGDAEAGRALPVDLRGGAFFHLSAFLRDASDGGLPTALYMNPSTSTRYDRFMPTLIRTQGLRLVGGKGGLGPASVEAMRETGCAYLSFLGGGCPLLSRAIERVVSSHWNEYISQFRLVTLRVRDLPAVVAIDAAGNSVYESLSLRAHSRLAGIREELARKRAGAPARTGPAGTTP